LCQDNNMTKEHFKIILIFDALEAEKIIAKALVGKMFKAFGPDSESFWRKKGPEKKFTIEKVRINYIDTDKYSFFSLDIFPKNYDAEKDYLYTDDKFEKELQEALPFVQITFSEQGMQGSEFANFDVGL